MQIHHDNYEEWLIRYLDGELSNADRAVVEAFANNHPDIKEELRLLQATILPAEPAMPMPNKADLYKPTLWDAEKLTTVQVQMLLMADGALPMAEKQALTTQIAEDPILEKEWKHLMASKLMPEAAESMPGKAMLYRQADALPVARLVQLRRTLQWAAAAAILAMGLVAAWQYNTPFTGSGTAAVAIEKESSTAAPSSQDKSANENALVQQETASTLVQAPGTEEEAKTSITIAPKNQVAVAKIATPARNTALPANATPVPYPVEANIQTNSNETAAVADATGKTLQTNIGAGIAAFENTGLPATPALNADLVATLNDQALPTLPSALDVAELPATFTNWEATQDDKDEVVHIAGLRIPRQKLRGAYRTISRPISRLFDKSTENTLAAR